MAISVEAAKAAAGNVLDPELQRPLADAGMLGDVQVDGDAVSLTITLTTPACPLKERIQDDVTAALKKAGAAKVTVSWDSSVPERNILPDDPCPGVRNIVLVMSGKGGVGKSTVATNLTLALNRLGCRVGLLDADMYGPSIPTMLGVMGRPTSLDGKRFTPLERFGVKLMSIGFLLDDAQECRGLAWTHDPERAHAVHERRRLGHPRLPDPGSATGNGRHRVDDLAKVADHRSARS